MSCLALVRSVESEGSRAKYQAYKKVVAGSWWYIWFWLHTGQGDGIRFGFAIKYNINDNWNEILIINTTPSRNLRQRLSIYNIYTTIYQKNLDIGDHQYVAIYIAHLCLGRDMLSLELCKFINFLNNISFSDLFLPKMSKYHVCVILSSLCDTYFHRKVWK